MVRLISFHSRLSFLCVLLFATVIQSVSQTIEPTPLIRHYSVNIEDLYSIWDVVATPGGTMLMAGENGLIEYDGHQFKKLLPGTILSVAIDPDDHTVYVGTDRTLGFLKKDQQGNIQLEDLSGLLPDSIVLTYFRYVHNTKHKVFFLSSTNVFEYDKAKKTFFTYHLSDKIRNGFTVGDSLFIGDPSTGMMVLHNKTIELAPFGAFFKGNDIQSALTLPSGWRLLGWRELILYDPTGKKAPAPYALKSGKKNVVTNAYASSSLESKYNLLVHDVVPGGATIIDTNQNVLFNYSGTPGLSGSDLVSAGVDRQKNFWLGYYYTGGGALTKIEHGQDIKMWSKENGLPSIHSITRFKGNLFVGTSNGLFTMDAQGRLNRLAETAGPYYTLSSVKIAGEEKLLISDDGGLKEWTGNKLVPIIQGAGEVVYQTRKRSNRIILTSSTRSLSILYEKGKWKQESEIQQTAIEPMAEAPDGSIWINVRGGVAKINTDTVPFRTTTYPLPPELSNALTGALFTSPNGNILIGTGKGIYAVDPGTNKIVPWEGFGQELAKRGDKVLYQVQLNDSTYFMSSNKPSAALICTLTKAGTIIHEAPFKRLPDKGKTNCVWSDPDGTIWMGGSYGVISYNPKWDTKDYRQPFNCLIQKVKVAGDSTIFNGSLSFIAAQDVPPVLHYSANQMQFEFAAPFFDKEEETLYSYRLQGMTDTWSEWDKVYYKEYSNLDEATYIFEVKAKNIFGTESAVASYTFTILPPWYRTWWAYVLFVGFASIGITVLIRQRTNYINQKRKELEKIVEQQTGELKSSNEELRASNESLIVTQRKLIASEKMASLGQLTAGIAHEINNPINFISGGVQALRELQHEVQNRSHLLTKEALQVKNNEIEELMTSIINGVHRTSEIIKSLREFSSPYDQLDNTAYTNVPECITNSLLLMNSRIKDAGIVVSTDFAVQTPAHAIAAQVSQVIINLVDNSIDAVLQRTDRQIKITAEETKREIVIRVTDNGTGIPIDKQSHIFEPFFTTKSVGKGIGLGLFICYSIVQKHGGSLTFESNANGTTFMVALPKKAV